MPGDFPPKFLELPPVFLDAYLTARDAAGAGLRRAVTADRTEMLFREAPNHSFSASMGHLLSCEVAVGSGRGGEEDL